MSDYRERQQRKDLAALSGISPPSPPPFSPPNPTPGFTAQPIAVDLSCPYCNSMLEIPAHLVGGQVSCGACNGAFETELPRVPTSSNRNISRAYYAATPNGAILPCIIVSLVGNAISAMFWLFLMPPVIAIPVAMGVCEIVFLVRMGQLSKREVHRYARTLAIWEIVSGICTNWLTLIAGIVILSTVTDE